MNELHTTSQRRAATSGALAVAALAALMLAASPAFAAIPATVLFEGALQSTTGGPASDGEYDVTFALYEDIHAQAAFWTETAKVKVVGGQFSHVLGSVKSLDAAALAAKSAPAIGLTIGQDPELPRAALHSAAFALSAAVAASAEKVSCTACITVSQLKFDDNVDLGANGLKVGTITAAQVNAQGVTAQTVTATSFVGDGSKLTGIPAPAGKCPSGKVVSGINADGTLACVSTAGSLPKDGLNEISNDMLTNQFVETFAMPDNEKGLKIPDNTGIEAISTIVVPDVGISEEFFKITVDITNTDLSTVSLVLLPPDDKKTGYILCDPCGKTGEKSLKTSFPDPSATKTGDLKSWIGKNPKGTWNLKVKDTSFCIPQAPGNAGICDVNTTTDGKIVDWSVNFQVLSNAKVLVNGDLLVAGKILSAGSNDVKAQSNKNACDAKLAGVIRFEAGVFEGCDGSSWVQLSDKGHMYRWAVWSTHDQAHGWFANNNASLFGGVNPSTWGDGNGMAYQMSDKTEVLRTLFLRRGPKIGAVENAMVYAEEHRSYSSTNSRHAGALFRIKNTTNADVNWNVSWYRTSYSGWSERASIAVNGTNFWNSGGSNYGATSASTHTITLPKNRTSTVIFVVASSSPSSDYRGTFLAFYNNSLKLPNGLEYVDDLDTKPDGWNN
jgi:hypothetical protein